ncbi:MAG: hypothetical protein V1897_18235 [Pseudomonadota bacterium]
MNWRLRILTEFPCIFLVVSLVVVLGVNGKVLAQGADSDCSRLKAEWEQLYQVMKDKVDSFAVLEQSPVERIIKRPIVNPNESTTIAAQVSAALQIKEDLLTAQRTEMRNLMNSEVKVFNQLQHCVQTDKSSKNKDAANISKKRRALLDKMNVSLAEVKEVEGRETVMPYSEAAGQDQYRRSVNNQWPNQDPYRRWWGY